MKLGSATGRARRFAAEESAESAGGFTLIELMVVLVLIAIMSALILPEMKGSFEHELLRASGRKLAAAFRTAYSQAVTLNEAQRLRIDRTTGRYTVEPATARIPRGRHVGSVAKNNVTEGKLDLRIQVEIRKSALTSGEPATEDAALAPSFGTGSGPDTVLFYPDGTAEAAQVILHDRHGFGLVLRVNPITARVSMADLNRGEAE